jgi:hypothetical protein
MVIGREARYDTQCCATLEACHRIYCARAAYDCHIDKPRVCCAHSLRHEFAIIFSRVHLRWRMLQPSIMVTWLPKACRTVWTTPTNLRCDVSVCLRLHWTEGLSPTGRSCTHTYVRLRLTLQIERMHVIACQRAPVSARKGARLLCQTSCLHLRARASGWKYNVCPPVGIELL